MGATSPNLSDASPARNAAASRTLLILALLLLPASIILFSAIGASYPAWAGPVVLLDRLIHAAWAPLAYIGGTIGVGWLARPLFAKATDALALQVAVGLALMLWLSHLLAHLGLITGPGATRTGLAWAPVAIGLIALLAQLVTTLRARTWSPRAQWPTLLAAPAIGLLIVAACNPPGSLWGSEFAAYDSLSYHLQLPQEWLATSLDSLRHNVYSFLPSHVEAAFTHLGSMMGANTHPAGLLASDGSPVIAAHLLHAALTIAAAWLTGRAARTMLTRALPTIPEPAAATAAALAAALILLTPWTIVVGSLAYNEMAMVAFFAAGLLAALDDRLPLPARGFITGLLAASAAAAKLSALLFVGVPLALVLLATIPPRMLWKAILPGSIAALLTLAPWLARNYLEAGNPVFPFAAGLFPNNIGGTGHWTQEQAARFASGHRFTGSLLDRLSFMVMTDPTDPAGPRHRGMMHPQWALFFPLVLASFALLLLRPKLANPPQRPYLRPALLLGSLLLVQIALWLFATHIQSRFLIPLIVPGAILFALAFAARSRPIFPFVAALLLLGQGGLLLRGWLRELNGQPNRLLLESPANLAGENIRQELASRSERERAQWLDGLPPELYINFALPANARLTLIGNAAPFYITHRPLRYSTTWDTPPALKDGVLSTAGFDFALVDLGEVQRLEKSGWIDPALSFNTLRMWLMENTTPVRAWPERGVFLVAPKPPAPKPTAMQPPGAEGPR